MSAASRSLLALLVVLALLAGTMLAPPTVTEPAAAAPAAAPMVAPEFAPAALAARADRATRSVLVDAAAIAPVALPARALSLRGSIAGPAPGYGDAWIVEAFRLTSTRDSVIEQRRVFVDARGAFAFAALAEGVWQVALVAPSFAWGPIVDLTPARAVDQIRLPVSGIGRLHVELIAGALWQRGARVRVELFALRAPPPAEPTLRLPIRVLQRELRLGETCTIEGLVAGVFEVRASLLDDNPEGGLRPIALAEASLADRDARVELQLPATGTPAAATSLSRTTSNKQATALPIDSAVGDARRRTHVVRDR